MPTLRPYQQQLEHDIYAAWQDLEARGAPPPGGHVVGFQSATGSGKCLGRGTPVMLYDGSVAPVETIKPGDLLMGPDSRPRRVVSIARGREAMYRVVPTKGDPYEVNESHILSLRLTPRRSGDADELVNLSVREYLQRHSTFKHRAKGWRVGVDFEAPQPDVLIPPYHFGVWLGDGDSKGFAITTGDAEVVDAFRELRVALGLSLRVESNSPGSIVMHFPQPEGSRVTGRGGAPLGNFLRSLGVLRNKHIPAQYALRSRTDRLELLAGILDSDGHFRNGCYDVTFKSERLMDDTIRLARSLGFAAYKAPCRKKCHNNGAWGDYFRCTINGTLDEIPCRVERQKAPPRRQKKNVLRVGIRVEPLGEGDYFGFEVAGPDRLFLLGDFTVTHNTVTFCDVVAREPDASALIAHRGELVSQMSLALARNGIRHRVVGSKAVIRNINGIHMAELGRSFYDSNARCGVVSIDSLPSLSSSDPWLHRVKLWVTDEGHHVLRDNKWGKGIAMLPNARRGLLASATWFRADGKGLGRHADGLCDRLVMGPSMRYLIDQGYLTDYRLIAAPSDVDYSDVTVTASGDLSPQKLRAAVHKSTRIVGDVVTHYLKFAAGKLGVTFAVDIEAAEELALAYQKAGVPAQVVSAKTPDVLRMDILRRFARREILQLVNVDLFGEGFDLPAIEVVSMVRKTESTALFDQQFGRALRLMLDKDLMARWDSFTSAERLAHVAASSKPRAIIIDHVGNAERHKLPDGIYRFHTLDKRERGTRTAKNDGIPLRNCLNETCLAVYERVLKVCPHCGTPAPAPASRSEPEFVDGDLTEFDENLLKRLRGEIDRVTLAPTIPFGASPAVQQAVRNRHFERQHAQGHLRKMMEGWAGWQAHAGQSDSEIYRRFYFTFGTDMLTAQTLDRADSEALRERIAAALAENNVIVEGIDQPVSSV